MFPGFAVQKRLALPNRKRGTVSGVLALIFFDLLLFYQFQLAQLDKVLNFIFPTYSLGCGGNRRIGGLTRFRTRPVLAGADRGGQYNHRNILHRSDRTDQAATAE